MNAAEITVSSLVRIHQRFLDGVAVFLNLDEFFRCLARIGLRVHGIQRLLNFPRGGQLRISGHVRRQGRQGSLRQVILLEALRNLRRLIQIIFERFADLTHVYVVLAREIGQRCRGAAHVHGAAVECLRSLRRKVVKVRVVVQRQVFKCNPAHIGKTMQLLPRFLRCRAPMTAVGHGSRGCQTLRQKIRSRTVGVRERVLFGLFRAGYLRAILQEIFVLRLIFPGFGVLVGSGSDSVVIVSRSVSLCHVARSRLFDCLLIGLDERNHGV